MARKVFDWRDVSLYPEDRIALGSNAISQALFNIINIIPGEVIFHPTFGCDLEDLLFSPIDDLTASNILINISQSITDWDPRMMILRNKSSVIPDADNNRYDVNLVIMILDDTEEEYNFSFNLNRMGG